MKFVNYLSFFTAFVFGCMAISNIADDKYVSGSFQILMTVLWAIQGSVNIKRDEALESLKKAVDTIKKESLATKEKIVAKLPKKESPK